MNNQKYINSIEFNKIQEMLAECIPVSFVKPRAYELLPYDDIDDVKRALSETTAATRLLSFKGMPPFGGVKDEIESVKWMDNDEELAFVQGDNMLAVDFTGQPYGKSYPVRVAKAVIK